MSQPRTRERDSVARPPALASVTENEVHHAGGSLDALLPLNLPQSPTTPPRTRPYKSLDDGTSLSVGLLTSTSTKDYDL